MFYDETKTINACDSDPSLIFELLKEEHMEIVDDYFDRIAGDIPIHSENVAEKRSLKVKADDVKLDVKPESADKVEIRIIDGRKYLVIPMDSDIEVNGIIRRINETLKEE